MPRLDGRLAGGSMATGGGFGAVGVSGGGGGTGACAFGAFGVGGGWTYDAGNKLSASTRPSSLATLPKPVASINLTKSLFSMACLVLRVSASTFFALAWGLVSGDALRCVLGAARSGVASTRWEMFLEMISSVLAPVGGRCNCES